jgi:ADP-heptose:LPS heptosyltransferase
MNPDTQRSLDRLAGVPLCFLGTLLKKIAAPFSGKRPPTRPSNVLFVELTEMGSAILADPAMRKAQRALGANLHFATFARNAAAVELLGTVPRENIFAISDASLASVAAGACRLPRWARAHGIDAVVDLELFSRFTALLSGFSGAGRRVGFHQFHGRGLYRGDLFTHRVAYNPHQHIAKNYVALVNALLSETAETPYSKTVVPDEEVAPCRRPVSGQARDAMVRKIREACPAYDPTLHRVVLLNTDSSALIPLRRWPPEHFIAVAAMILQRNPDVLILLTGDAAERAGKERFTTAVGSERCVNFAGRTAIAELPALYSLSALLLTNDSGPAHIASLAALPVFVLFGPETPRLYAPLGGATVFHAGLACSPCVSAANQRKSPCTDNVCLQAIRPEEVFDALQLCLDTRGDVRR